MSTAAPYSSSSSAQPSMVTRSHSTSSRYPSRQHTPSDVPQRTRSVAVKPSTPSHPRPQQLQHLQQVHPSHLRSHSYDPRPASSTYAAPENVARRDHDPSRVSRSSSSRRNSYREHSQEPPPAAHRTDHYRRQYRRSPSPNSRQREGIDMPAPAVPEDATGTASGNLHPSVSAMQPKRRTTITTPSGQWLLGKTIGAGSMGKVKLAKNVETGEQVSALSSTCHIATGPSAGYH